MLTRAWFVCAQEVRAGQTSGGSGTMSAGGEGGGASPLQEALNGQLADSRSLLESLQVWIVVHSAFIYLNRHQQGGRLLILYYRNLCM